MLEHIDMVEVPGTSFDVTDPPGVAQFTRLLASRSAPVFQASIDHSYYFSEVVAVTFRNADGKPVHGGLFGVDGQTVVSLSLKDCEGKVDTGEDPAYVAIGLIMMRGPLVFRQRGADEEMQMSIVDIDARTGYLPLERSTPAREAVRLVYMSMVLPNVAEQQASGMQDAM